jgi:hypothetical protein
MTSIEFDAGESWSVVYAGIPYDDARKIRGAWYFRDPATGAIHAFSLQDRVILRQQNTPANPEDHALRKFT